MTGVRLRGQWSAPTAQPHCKSPAPKSFVARLFCALAAILALAACGSDGGTFRLEGRFRHFNQGELYVYSPEGAITGRDTIVVRDGRFAYEAAITDAATLMLVFPNYSEQPVFAEPGASVSINADASHLREMNISGTDDNEAMTEFRLHANSLTPPEAKAEAEKFIGENPASPVSLYLLNRYLIENDPPDYSKAYDLVGKMVEATPDNVRLTRLHKQLKGLMPLALGGQLPSFTATAVDSVDVSQRSLTSRVNVVSVWASWSYDSRELQRQLRAMQKKHPGELGLVSVCLDADKQQCRRIMKQDSITWPNICDGQMWNTPLLARLGLATVPGNIIADAKGKIIGANLNAREMRERLEELLK